MYLFDIKNLTTPNNAEKHMTEFQTPPSICRYMASLVPIGMKTVLEPTPGIGNIVTALTEKGFEVTAPQDFFLLGIKKFDAIVMNPPFSSKYAFMENSPLGLNKQGMRLGYYILTECMNMSNNVIALMPWFTISDSDVRLRYLKDYGLKSLTALPRSTFKYARIQTVVIELQKGYTSPTQFNVYDRIQNL
jgi:type I restriction-modification system DNA methylase subunit